MNHFLISSLVTAAWRRRYLVAIPLLLLLPASLLIASITPRVYQSTALLMLPESPGLGNAQSGYAFSQEMAAKMKGLDALLRSDYVLADVLSRGLPGEPAVGTMQDRIEDLRKRIGTKPVSDIFVQVTLLGGTPSGLGDKLNAVLASLFEGLLSPAHSANDAVSFLARQRQAEIEAIERRIREVEAKAPNLTESMVRDNESMSKSAEDRIAAKQRHLEAERTKLQRSLEAVAGSSIAKGRDQKQVTPEAILKQLLAERRAELAALKEKGEESTSAAKSIADAVASLEVLSNQQAELSDFSEEIRAERARVDNAKSMARNLASLMLQRKQLYDEIDQARARHARLLDRLKGPGGAAALNMLRAPAQVQIVDMPADPQRPLNSKMKILLIGITAAFAVSFGLATLVELLDPRVYGAAQLSSATGVPVIASLDKWPGSNSSDTPDTRVAAALRLPLGKAESAAVATASNVKPIRS